MKLREFFSDASKWTQHVYARNSNGDQVSPNDPNACCWCLSGGDIACPIEDYINTDTSDRCNKLSDYLWKKFKMNIPQFNDSHRFEEVKEVLDHLDI
jgi:hypothetical protein